MGEIMPVPEPPRDAAESDEPHTYLLINQKRFLDICGNARCALPLRPARGHGLCRRAGEVAEWSKAHAWKVCRRGTVSRVRIPLSPPAPLPCPPGFRSCTTHAQRMHRTHASRRRASGLGRSAGEEAEDAVAELGRDARPLEPQRQRAAAERRLERRRRAGSRAPRAGRSRGGASSASSTAASASGVAGSARAMAAAMAGPWPSRTFSTRRRPSRSGSAAGKRRLPSSAW